MQHQALNTDLCSKIRDDDELLQNVLGQNVRVSSFLDVVRGDVDVVGTEVKVGCRDGSHAPLRLGSECL